MAEPDYRYDIFISYSHSDEEYARKIKKRLEDLCAGTKIFLSSESVNPGENFVSSIEDALTQAQYFLQILSPKSVMADWPLAERTAALLQDPSGRLGRVIPIIIEDCNLPPLLSIRQWIDLRKKSNFEGGMERLARRVCNRPIPRQNGTSQSGSIKIPQAKLSGRSSYEPDRVTEVLCTNLYKVENLPVIMRGTSVFSSKRDVINKTKCKFYDCVLSSGSLYTLQNLKSPQSILKPAINPGSAENVPNGFWFENYDTKRLLTHLLNLQAGRLCNVLGLTYDKVGKRYYPNMSKIGTKRFHWVSHVRKSQRALILPYPENGPTRFYRHRSIKLSFQILGADVFLQLEPGWTFTWDGYRPIDDERRRKILNIYIQSRTKNDAQFAEQRFWAFLLSDGSTIKIGNGHNKMSICLEPLSMTSHEGICGDHIPAAFKQAEPPVLASGEDDEIPEEVDDSVLEEEGDDN